MRSVEDFIDGFELAVPAEITGPQLQRILKECGLDVAHPIAKNIKGHWWFQLASGPYDVAHVMPLLKQAADAIDHM